MATITPNWTDTPSSIISAQVLAKGSTLRGTFDLRTKLGGVVLIDIGRGGTTAIGTTPTIVIRSLITPDASPAIRHPGSLYEFTFASVAAANSTTVNANSNSGQAELLVASITGFAVGDYLCIQNADATVTRLEFARISKLTAGGGTGVTLDSNLLISHTAAQADTVRNKAESFPEIALPGGAYYEVVIDYGAAATGDSITVRALGRTFDSYTSA